MGRGHGSPVEDEQEGAGEEHPQEPQGPLQTRLLAAHVVTHLGAHVLPARVEAQHPSLLLFLAQSRAADCLPQASLPRCPTPVPRTFRIAASFCLPPPLTESGPPAPVGLTPSHTWLTSPSQSQVHVYHRLALSPSLSTDRCPPCLPPSRPVASALCLLTCSSSCPAPCACPSLSNPGPHAPASNLEFNGGGKFSLQALNRLVERVVGLPKVAFYWDTAAAPNFHCWFVGVGRSGAALCLASRAPFP